MDETTDTFPTYEEQCELRRHINDNMKAMSREVLDAHSILMDTILESQETLEGIIELPSDNLLPIEVRAKAREERPICIGREEEYENEEYKKSIERLLSPIFIQPENAFECANLLWIGFKYYSTRLSDKKFYLLTDLPELLTINHRMHSLILRAQAIKLTVFRKVKHTRTQRLSSKKIKKDNWEEIEEAIKRLEKKPEIAGKYFEEQGLYSKNRLADAINTLVSKLTSSRKIIDYIEDHLGNNATPPKTKYTIQEWMNMLKITSSI